MSNFSAGSEESFTMAFVISLTDGTGREFYISANGNTVALDAVPGEEPMIIKTFKQLEKQLDKFRKLFLETCVVYAVEHREFEERQRSAQKPPQTE